MVFSNLIVNVLIDKGKLKSICLFLKGHKHHVLLQMCPIQIQDKRFLCNLIYLKSLSSFAQTVNPILSDTT